MSITVLISFLLFTGFVVVFTYNKVKNDKHNSQDVFASLFSRSHVES